MSEDFEKELLEVNRLTLETMGKMMNRIFAYEAIFTGFITFYFTKTEAGRGEFERFAAQLRDGARDVVETGLAAQADAEQIENLLNQIETNIAPDQLEAAARYFKKPEFIN